MTGIEFFLLLALIPAYGIAIYAANKPRADDNPLAEIEKWKVDEAYKWAADWEFRKRSDPPASASVTAMVFREVKERLESLEAQLKEVPEPSPTVASRLARLERGKK